MKIYAHRGASYWLPENTLEAFELARSRWNTEGLELDIQMSRDRVPVVIHDARLDRTTQMNGYVRHHDYSDLLKADAAYHFRPPGEKTESLRGRGFRIPSLVEVIEACRGMELILEIKDRGEDTVSSVMDAVDHSGAAEFCVLGSFHRQVSGLIESSGRRFRQFASRRQFYDLWTCYCSGKRPQTSPDSFRTLSIPVQFRGIRLDERAWIDFLHTFGFRVIFWTIRDQATAEALQRAGADGIIVDDPGLFRNS